METNKSFINNTEILTKTDLQSLPESGNNFNPEIRRELETRLFHAIETHSWHNSYDQEVRELSAISNGDIHLLEKSLNEWAVGEIGTMAKDPLRNEKTNAIVVITNSSRAAIKGGLSSEIAFTLSDIYMEKVEECTSLGDPMKLTREAEYLYATLVHELKEGRDSGLQSLSAKNSSNEHVDSCKDYIFRHLHEKITVYDIAEALELNPDYLSFMFKKHEHISLSDYILKEKIALVKNLLIYSNYTYSEIAHYLGFSSQSHLGSRFKKETSYTMKEYRNLYQMKDFMD